VTTLLSELGYRDTILAEACVCLALSPRRAAQRDDEKRTPWRCKSSAVPTSAAGQLLAFLARADTV
jgi:hypothetical protein